MIAAVSVPNPIHPVATGAASSPLGWILWIIAVDRRGQIRCELAAELKRRRRFHSHRLFEVRDHTRILDRENGALNIR